MYPRTEFVCAGFADSFDKHEITRWHETARCQPCVVVLSACSRHYHDSRRHDFKLAIKLRGRCDVK
jgi:hypothetical protein